MHTHFDGMRIITLEGYYRRGEDGKAVDEIAFVKGKDRVTEALRANLATRNLKPANGSYITYDLKPPVRLPQDSIVQFQDVKAKNYVAWASAQSPGVGERNASITNGVTTAIEVGVGLFATVATGGVDFTNFFSGALGAVKKAGNLAIHTGRQWNMPPGYIVPALPVTGFDFAPYKHVDYRAISMGRGSDMLHGEIYIAYKEEKTPDTEDAALVVALTEALAVNSTKEQVQAAQLKELDLRVKIWGDCVASGACKD
jgi:hypothetical protein